MFHRGMECSHSRLVRDSQSPSPDKMCPLFELKAVLPGLLSSDSLFFFHFFHHRYWHHRCLSIDIFYFRYYYT